MGDQIDELIEEIIVDAYGDYEQLCSFRQAFEDDARFPFRGTDHPPRRRGAAVLR